MKTSLHNIITIVVKPRAVFTRLKDEPKWVVTLILCCIGVTIIMWATAPFETHIISYNTAEKVEDVNKMATTDRIIELIAEIISVSVVILILIVVLSLLFWAVVRLFRINRTVLKFSHIYVGVVHLALISVFVWGINTVLLLIFKSPQDVHTGLDMQMIPGLHQVGAFLKNEELLTFLSGFNILSLWEIAILAIAVEVLTEMKKPHSIFWATFIWLVSQVLGSLRF